MTLSHLSRLLSLLSALAVASIANAFTPTEDGLYAVFDTTMGEFTAKLYYEEVPITVASFVGLAENGIITFEDGQEEVVVENFYDGIIFHRVIAEFMIQGGSPNGLGTDGPGYSFPDELFNLIPHDKTGLLSMANSGPNSNGSQFFITVDETDWLDNRHTVFGEIIEGYEKVVEISEVETDTTQNPNGSNLRDKPIVDITINSLRIVRRGPAAKSFGEFQAVRNGDEMQLYKQLSNLDSPQIDIESFKVTIPAEAKFDYFRRNSTDLSNRSDYVLLPFEESKPTTRQHSVDANNRLNFYSYSRNALIPPYDLDGSTIAFSIPEDGFGDFEIAMEENGRGTFTQTIPQNQTIEGDIFYDLLDLEEFEQLYFFLIYADNSFFEIQMYLPLSFPDNGNAKTVVTDRSFGNYLLDEMSYSISPSE